MKNDPSATNPPQDHGEVVHRRAFRISLAWIFPILAAAATIWLFWSDWKSNGPEVEVQFDSAPGIQAGKTPLLYRGVLAGTVTKVRLDAGLDKVVLVVRLKEFASDLARKGTVFWIDQPVVGLGETSGLDALIQGNSLQARMGTGSPTTRFMGQSHVPLTPLESPALTLKLRAPSIPLVDRGSPLFYRGVEVGMVEHKALDEKGNPYLHVMVEKQFAESVKTNARFWAVPATSLKVGPTGVKLDLLGLKAILLGGLEFDVFGSPGAVAKDESEFTLYPDRVTAQATGAPVQIIFPNGQGILAGQTEVRYLGLPIGLVETATLNEATQTVDTVVRFQAAYDHVRKTGTVFTLVGPRISLNGVSGLQTIVGGPYIDCVPGSGPELASTFTGLNPSADASMSEEEEKEGTHITLHSKTLSLSREGTPVLYRGFVVGQVLSKGIDAKGEPFLSAVVRKEFAATLQTNARFWSVPAASAEVGAGILKVDVPGLSALWQGALAFDVFEDRETPATNGASFELFANEAAARACSSPVRVTFENGQGLLAGQTQVRYLGTPVGLVVDVAAKQGEVIATVRFYPGYEFLRREGSDFSVVRLNASLDGVSGVETLISGIYIEVVPSTGGRLVENFRGVSTTKANLAAAEERGFEIIVTTNHTALTVGAPVTYRGIPVGKVGRKDLSEDGRSVTLELVVDQIYASLIRENTKFWDASGMKLSLGFFNLKVRGGPLDTVSGGGVAFATPNAPGPVVKRGHQFTLNSEPRREWLRWAPDISVKN